MRAVRSVAGLMVLTVGLLGLVGCADAEKMQIARLQDENGRLNRENSDLKSRLAAALRDVESNRRAMDQLQQELANARAKFGNLPEGWQPGPGYAWIDVGEDILFDSGKATLKTSGQTALRQVVGQIRSNAELAACSIWIVGHTDRQPIKNSKWMDNLELSVQRGASVTREMYKLGLDPKSVVAAGQGEFNPKAQSEKLDVPQNRRVQIMAIPRPAGGIKPATERGEKRPAQPAADTSMDENG